MKTFITVQMKRPALVFWLVFLFLAKRWSLLGTLIVMSLISLVIATFVRQLVPIYHIPFLSWHGHGRTVYLFLSLLTVELNSVVFDKWLQLEAAPAHSAVLITGTSSGLGRAFALHLAGRGVVVLAGVRNQVDAKSIKAAAADPAFIVPIIMGQYMATIICYASLL
jgi:uncharacterized membrane protein